MSAYRWCRHCWEVSDSLELLGAVRRPRKRIRMVVPPRKRKEENDGRYERLELLSVRTFVPSFSFFFVVDHPILFPLRLDQSNLNSFHRIPSITKFDWSLTAKNKSSNNHSLFPWIILCEGNNYRMITERRFVV